MISYGCVVGSEQRYRRWTLPGIRRAAQAAEPIEVRGANCIFEGCNEIIDRARERNPGDLEAIVIVHDDVEILDSGLEPKLRAAIAAGEGSAGVVGVVGGSGVSDMGWWQCERPLGRVRWLAPKGQGPFGSIPGAGLSVVGPGGEGPVDAVDGLLLALVGEGIERLRFDTSLGPGFHGYDADICRQALSAGLQVRVAPIDCVHHNDGMPSDAERSMWMQAHVRFRRKWEAAAPPPAPGSVTAT